MWKCTIGSLTNFHPRRQWVWAIVYEKQKSAFSTFCRATVRVTHLNGKTRPAARVLLIGFLRHAAMFFFLKYVRARRRSGNRRSGSTINVGKFIRETVHGRKSALISKRFITIISSSRRRRDGTTQTSWSRWRPTRMTRPRHRTSFTAYR